MNELSAAQRGGREHATTIITELQAEVHELGYQNARWATQVQQIMQALHTRSRKNQMGDIPQARDDAGNAVNVEVQVGKKLHRWSASTDRVGKRRTEPGVRLESQRILPQLRDEGWEI